MSTVREQILAALVTQLNTSRPAGVPAAERGRTRKLAKAQLPSILVFPHEEAVSRLGSATGPLATRQLAVLIETRAAASSGPAKTADQNADASLAWLTKALVDQRLGNLVERIFEVKHEWAWAQGETPYCLVVSQFVVHYHTRAADAELRA